MFYSKSTNGFYDPEINSGGIPSDSVEISKEEHIELLNGQESGKIIAADPNGKPVLIDPPAPTAEQIAEAVAAVRSAAYIAESDPLFFKSQRGEATHEEWLAKIKEIKARYPEGEMPPPPLI